MSENLLLFFVFYHKLIIFEFLWKNVIVTIRYFMKCYGLTDTWIDEWILKMNTTCSPYLYIYPWRSGPLLKGTSTGQKHPWPVPTFTLSGASIAHLLTIVFSGGLFGRKTPECHTGCYFPGGTRHIRPAVTLQPREILLRWRKNAYLGVTEICSDSKCSV